MGVEYLYNYGRLKQIYFTLDIRTINLIYNVGEL